MVKIPSPRRLTAVVANPVVKKSGGSARLYPRVLAFLEFCSHEYICKGKPSFVRY